MFLYEESDDEQYGEETSFKTLDISRSKLPIDTKKQNQEPSEQSISNVPKIKNNDLASITIENEPLSHATSMTLLERNRTVQHSETIPKQKRESVMPPSVPRVDQVNSKIKI